MSYYSGQGKLYYADRDASGQPKGFVPFGNVPNLDLSVEIQKFEHKESMSGQRAIDLTLIQEKKGTFTMTMEDLTMANLALAFWGENAATAAAVAATQVITGYLGKKQSVQGFVNISNVAVKDDATKLITYEFGTSEAAAGSKNGWIDEANGSIHIFTDAEQTAKAAANNISDAEALEITFDHVDVVQMNAFTQTSQQKYLRFEGLNTVDNTPVVIDIFKADLDPLSGYALLNEELGSVEITGSFLYDELQPGNDKFFREIVAGTL